MTWRGGARRVREAVFRLADSVSAVLVLAVTAMVMLRILDRLYGAPLTGYAEYAQTMVLWIIFLGVGRAAYHGDDIRSDWILDQLSESAESGLRALILVLNAIVVSILVGAIAFALLEFQGRVTPGAAIPFPLLHGALFVGFVILLGVYVALIAKGIRATLGGLV